MKTGSIPVIVVGGYLGAGKTTLINDFLRAPKGLRVLVLVNDFGAINIDADLIENTSGDTISLTNGCACCSIGDSLLEAALAATERPDPPDLLVVEASGVSRPARIADTLLGVPALAPSSCVTVVNGARVERNFRDKYIGELFRTQIETADCLVLNRFDAAARRAFLLGNAHQPLVQSIADMLGIGLAPERTGHLPTLAPDPVDSFEKSVFFMENPITPEQLEAWLAALPTGIERLKGTMLVEDETGEAKPMFVSYSQGLAEVCDASPRQAAKCGTVVLIANKAFRD